MVGWGIRPWPRVAVEIQDNEISRECIGGPRTGSMLDEALEE